MKLPPQPCCPSRLGATMKTWEQCGAKHYLSNASLWPQSPSRQFWKKKTYKAIRVAKALSDSGGPYRKKRRKQNHTVFVQTWFCVQWSANYEDESPKPLNPCLTKKAGQFLVRMAEFYFQAQMPKQAHVHPNHFI